MVQLSPEQAAIPARVRKGRNVFVTGQAGTGKSTVLNLLRSKYGRELAVTASTGIAALNVRGTTLHTFAGLIKGEEPAQVIAKRIIEAKRRAYRNITQTRILAIDEISMLSGELLTKVDQVFRAVRRNDSPFGGMQILAFGDFLQLPPVSKDPFHPAAFAFESPTWSEAAIELLMLTKVYRQEDQPFVDALARLRVGDNDHPSYEIIGGRNDLDPPDDDAQTVIIDTHNAEVDRLNLSELQAIREPEFEYASKDSFSNPAYLDRLNRDCLAPPLLRLKKGAQVMLLANLDVENGLANGSLGVVESCSRGSIVVRFGKREVEIDRWSWEIQNNGDVMATREQYPLRLAWAITSHKVQGMTLDRILCRLGNTFEDGQAYVAVSRVKKLEGLFLRHTTRQSFRANARAVEFYAQACASQATASSGDQREFSLS